MDDLKQRDLSRIPESQMTPAELDEIERRKNEFLAMLRHKGGLPASEPKKPEKKVTPWDPRAIARSR